jgi:hypothetical protein
MQGAVKTLVFLSLLHSACAHAGVFYMCKDAAGRTLTSDRPIPECADRTIREYGSNGVLKREIVPPLTAEQKREKAAEAQRRKAELAAVEEQKRSDRALLARYRSEDDIAQARQREGAPLIEQLGQQKDELAVAEKEWQAIRTAVDTQREKGNVPQMMQTKHVQALENVRVRKNAVRDSEAILARINAKYDAVLQRYRDIAQMVSSK